MNVVYAITNSFHAKLIPSLTSLMEHNPNANVYVVTESDTVDVPFNVHVININKQDYFPTSSVNYHNQFTYINLLKVCYASLLRVNKVIHLDVDTIICDSLEPLWNTDVNGKWFAACPEYQGKYKPFGDLYYNMGVVLINLKQMRADKIEPLLVEYLNAFRQPFADQDAWNWYAIAQNKAVSFPIRYNENFATGYTNDPAIVHYCGMPNWWNNPTMYRREYLDKYRN